MHYNIAKLLADKGDKKSAIGFYETAIQMNPNYFHAMNNLANIHRDIGNYSNARKLLSEAVRLRPDFAAAHMNLGIVQTALKNYDDAERSFFNALNHRPIYAECWFNLGNMVSYECMDFFIDGTRFSCNCVTFQYLENEKTIDALNAWRNATILKPQLVAAWNNMIILCENRKEYENAIIVAKQALDYHQNDSSLHFNYANVSKAYK